MAGSFSHFMGGRDTLVTDAIDGLLAASGGRLARLDGYPDIRVVLRADRDAAKVAVVSGGGSGHEPAHAGFVGAGLLDAAVCGDVFASPSVDAVLAGILAVTGPSGCLLIVKNYAGDRLNFGLAAERARGLGLSVEAVIVSDDVALPGVPQPRGIAGTLFVHKVAGHAAAAGRSLAEVAGVARRAAGTAKSLGIAVSTATIPGSHRAERMAEGSAELGLGIHGEPGAERLALPEAAELARIMTGRLSGSLPEAGQLALLVNNLGATTALEMHVLTRAVLATDLGRRVRLLLGPSSAMTALDMHGASLSFLPLDDGLEGALLAPTGVPAWTQAVRIAPPVVRPLAEGLRGETFVPSRDERVAARIRAVASALAEGEADLNALDARVGDGDTGTTFAGRPGTCWRNSTACPRPTRRPSPGPWRNGSAGRPADRAVCWPRSSSRRHRPPSRRVGTGPMPWQKGWRGSGPMAARAPATARCSTPSFPPWKPFGRAMSGRPPRRRDGAPRPPPG